MESLECSTCSKPSDIIIPRSYFQKENMGNLKLGNKYNN